MISVAEIEDKLRDRVDQLARELLPNARREGNYLKIGSTDGEVGGSMAIYLHGERQGRWEDFAGGEYGDMLDLIAATKRLTKGEAVAWAKGWLGIEDRFVPGNTGPSPEERARAAEEARARAEKRQAAEAQEREAKMKGARALFLRENSVAVADTPADWYLRGRLLEPVAVRPGAGATWPGSLRFNPDVYHGGERCRIAAMLAMAVMPDGTHTATHRTFLQNCPRRGWTKIDSPNAKMVLGAIGGAFVPINKGASNKSMRDMPAGEPIYVTEGIEDALVVRMKRPEARIIAAYSVGNIGAIVLPPAATRLVIVADRDEKVKAQAALERTIARQQARGVKVDLVFPPVGFKDFNDWLRGASSATRSGAA